MILLQFISKISKNDRLPILSSIIFLLALASISFPNALASSIDWKSEFYDFNDGGVIGGGFDSFGAPVIVEVIDMDSLGAGSIQVNVTSSVNPIGFSLTLNEGSLGTFTNTNLALMSDDGSVTPLDSLTITIFDDTSPDPLKIQNLTSPPRIMSDSNTTGITPVFIETGIDTNFFSATINFATSSDNATNSLEGKPGDIFSVWDSVGENAASGFIYPNPNLGKGAILAEIAGTVTATYQGNSDSFLVKPTDGGGRGTGGLIRPGLVADSSSGANDGSGSGCINCSPPTLGLDSKYDRIVTQGFSFNENPVDVEYHFTPYPLITAKVGQENKIVLKIFDDGGTQNIEHVGLAFGLGKGQYFSESKATINLDRTLDGREKTSTFDPENVFDDVKITTSNTSCNSIASIQCLEVTIYQTFRDGLEFNIVSTNVWDSKKNAWQNFYNHGIEITGDSMNPPKTKMVAFGEKDMRGSYELTEIDKKKHLWIDKFHNIYENKGNDRFDRIVSTQDMVEFDKETSHGCDRNCNWFSDYKLNQEILAKKTMGGILHGKIIERDSTKEPFSYTYKMTNRAEDFKLQEAIISENIKAEKLVKKILNPWDYPNFNQDKISLN